MHKNNMNILIPMAGEGKRFFDYDSPKPLIDVNGKPMIQRAIESLDIDGKYIFIIRESHDTKYLKNTLSNIVDDPIFIEINYTTEGPASTCLLAEKYINNNVPLITANCDQILKWNSKAFLKYTELPCDGVVVTYTTQTEKNSYVKLDSNHEYAVEFAEKKVISNYSLNGIHYWKKGRYFVESAKQMINENLKVNNEFYIAPSYNQMIKNNKKIKIFHLLPGQHWAIGTPEDLNKYLSAYKDEEI